MKYWCLTDASSFTPCISLSEKYWFMHYPLQAKKYFKHFNVFLQNILNFVYLSHSVFCPEIEVHFHSELWTEDIHSLYLLPSVSFENRRVINIYQTIFLNCIKSEDWSAVSAWDKALLLRRALEPCYMHERG